MPITFDKRMIQQELGHGEHLLLLSIHETTVPEDVEAAFLLWRARAEAAAGALASVLDERVAGPFVFEDVVVLSEGQPIGALDMQDRVRSYLPLEVAAIDRPALEALEDVNLGDGSPVARAARLYRRGALEGPTADGYVMLWVAAESLIEARQPRKVDLDALLSEAGMDPHELPLHTGLLIDLRGKIVHEGLEDHDRLRVAFYEMEAIVRMLIRRTAKLRGGWWPTHDIATYAEPWPSLLAASDSTPQSIWHEGRMPKTHSPAPERIPRKATTPDSELLVSVTDALRDAAGEHLVLLTLGPLAGYRSTAMQPAHQSGGPALRGEAIVVPTGGSPPTAREDPRSAKGAAASLPAARPDPDASRASGPL